MAIELTQNQLDALGQALSDDTRTAIAVTPPVPFNFEGTLNISVRWQEEAEGEIVARMGIVLSPPAWIYIPWMAAQETVSGRYVELVCRNLPQWARDVGYPNGVIQASSGTEQLFKAYGFQGNGQWLYCDVTSTDNPIESQFQE